METHYAEEYWEKRPTSDTSGAISAEARKRADAFVTAARDRITRDDLIVEVGAGWGEILAVVRDRLGCHVLAVEPSFAEVEEARTRFALPVQRATIETVVVDPPARAILMSHALEHFHNPLAALRRARTLLRSDGLLWIEVPNMLRPNPRKDLRNWLATEHMSYFSIDTLTAFLARAGFSVLTSEATHVVRVLATVSSAAVPDYLPNQWGRVWRAVLWHECQYWPRRVAWKLAGRWACT
jgi:hypothetical protein